MKTKLFVIGIVILGMMSCKGSGSRRVAKEAVEFIENKGSRMMEKEGSRVIEEEESEASRYLKNKRRADRIEEYINESTEDESQYQSQPIAAICGQCGGYGFVYLTDGYGNVMYDYYGNPQTSICPVCGGTGSQTVYQ